MMIKTIGLTTVFISLFSLHNAYALLINESISITITSITGFSDYDPGIVVGDMVHLFDVEYDNAGTEMHDYHPDGSVKQTYIASSAYSFLSDATFTLSPLLQQFVNDYGGTNAFTTINSRVYQRSTAADDKQQYWKTSTDFIIRVIMDDTTGDGMFDNVSGDFGVYRVLPSSGAADFSGINFAGNFTITDPSSQTPVPEPATMLLFGTGIAGLVGSRIRRKK